MKIIHVIPTIRTSGGIRILQNNLLHFPPNIENIIWANKIEEELHFHKTKIELTKHSNFKYFFNIYRRLKKEKRNNIIIHIHGRNGFLVFLVAKFLKYRVVYQAHGYYYKLSNRKKLLFINNLIDNLILKYSDFVLFCSNSEKKFALKNYSVNSNNRIILNRTQNNKKNDDRHIKINKKNYLIYCLATSNIYQKGIDQQLELVKDLKRFTKNFKLIHYFNFQNNAELEIIKEKIEKLNLSDNYFLRNAIPSIWEEIYEKQGILISTSRFEGMPMVILEAFHNFIPVVATNCYGQEDLLKEKRALILKKNERKMWAENLFNFMIDEEKKIEKSKHAKEWVISLGKIENYSLEIINCYKFLLGK